MNIVRFARYMGAVCLFGGAAGLMVSMAFMLLLNLTGFLAVYALSFCACNMAAGCFSIFYKIKEKETV